MSLIEEARVAIVPGSAFGKGGESHIRISFGAEEDVLREGLRRLTGFLNRTVGHAPAVTAAAQRRKHIIRTEVQKDDKIPSAEVLTLDSWWEVART